MSVDAGKNIMIYFIRHAESVSNAGGRTSDVVTIPLSEKGIVQAADFAQHFKIKPDLVIMSPFIRTQQTAAPYLAQFPAVKTEIWNIQEFCCLDLDRCANTTPPERRELVVAYYEHEDPDYIDGRGAESFNQLLRRVDDMLTKLRLISPEQNIVVFSHGLFMRAIQFRMMKAPLSLKFFFNMESLPNLAVLQLDLEHNSLTRYNVDGFKTPEYVNCHREI